MRTASMLTAALLACVALTQAADIQEFKFPKTVVVNTCYNMTTMVSEPISVNDISAAPWSKRSWNKTPKPAGLVSFSKVIAYKPSSPVANATISNPPNNTEFTVALASMVPIPVTVQYIATDVNNNTIIGWAIVKNKCAKPIHKKPFPTPNNGTWDVNFTKPGDDDFPKPWEKNFTMPWEKNHTKPWEKNHTRPGHDDWHKKPRGL